jgi:hypothetical protein
MWLKRLSVIRQLTSPEVAANRILARLHRSDFGQPPVADVRE